VLSALVIVATGIATISTPISSARASDPPVENVYAYGAAAFYGSTGALALAQPIVGIATTRTGHGYWSVASDGGIFSFGDASFFGSTGALRLNRPIVGMAATPSGHGYWFVASDGGLFSFGDAGYHGSRVAAVGSTRAGAAPVVGMAATPTGDGYWIAASDATATGFGDAAGAQPRNQIAMPTAQAAIGIASDPVDRGYWLASAPATNPKIEAAIAWFTARVGQHVYTGQCEHAVELAFGLQQGYPTARANWLAQPVKHLDWQNAPRGALVFYSTSADGHVAISLGDGRVASTSVNSAIGIVPTGYFQNPLGWTASPFL